MYAFLCVFRGFIIIMAIEPNKIANGKKTIHNLRLRVRLTIHNDFVRTEFNEWIMQEWKYLYK